jgi:hypothetical protein
MTASWKFGATISLQPQSTNQISIIGTSLRPHNLDIPVLNRFQSLAADARRYTDGAEAKRTLRAEGHPDQPVCSGLKHARRHNAQPNC